MRHRYGSESSGVDTNAYNEQDAVPQPIEPVYTRIATATGLLYPHPLLCARDGVIDEFPDHMHEGEVIEEDAVELDLPLGIPRYVGVEYPLALDPTRPQPRPTVVAYGRTTSSLSHSAGSVNPKRFPLIGAYDGDEAGIGRVVVDSTWHHWFSLNLAGLRDGNPAAYEGMQAYYRNVGLWLATPAQRAKMLFALAWGAVVSDPMAFPIALKGDVWQVGKMAVDVIGRTAPQCILHEIVVAWLGARAVESLSEPRDSSPGDPFISRVPPEVVVRAIVGGVASALLEPALEYREDRSRGRPMLDPERIVSCATEGVELGRRALVDALRASAAASEKTADLLADGPRRLPRDSIGVPVELLDVRAEAVRLQLPDPTDPVLALDRVTFTIRMRVDQSWVANEVIETAVPHFGQRGAVLDLHSVLYEGVVQSGEHLLLEVVAGIAEGESVAPERVRFRVDRHGDPSTWLGVHEPSSTQPWRLWYRVEPTEGAPEAPAVP